MLVKYQQLTTAWQDVTARWDALDRYLTKIIYGTMAITAVYVAWILWQNDGVLRLPNLGILTLWLIAMAIGAQAKAESQKWANEGRLHIFYITLLAAASPRFALDEPPHDGGA